MTFHALDVLGDAITATREYRPEGIGQWLWVALAALLVGTPGISLPTGGSTGGTGTGSQELPPEARSEFTGGVPQEVVGAIAAIVAVLAVIWILFVVLGALLEFPFFAWLRDGEVDTFAEMRAHLGRALGLAAFRVVLGAIGFGVVAALLVATVGTDGSPFEYALAAGNLGIVLALVGLPVGVVTAFTTAFVVPTMMLENTGVIGGWRRVWSTLAGAPKQFLVYAVAVAVLAFVGGLAVFITAALALIPALIVGGILGVIVGLAGPTIAGIAIAAAIGGLAFTVVFLAASALVEVFLRYYALFVLAEVDEELDFAPERRRAVRSGDGADETPSTGTDDPQVGPQ
jgi:hypothetical protein